MIIGIIIFDYDLWLWQSPFFFKFSSCILQTRKKLAGLYHGLVIRDVIANSKEMVNHTIAWDMQGALKKRNH